jgi:hypothetical protein
MQNGRAIDGGSPEYWRNLKRGHMLIARAREALTRMKSARLYNLEGYDENGDAIVSENIGPFDDFEDACKAVEHDAMALSILRAQGVQRIGDREIIPW